MSFRPNIPETTKTELFAKSRRRCCMCYALFGDTDIKKGQIAHLDHNRGNNRLGNLVWLCLPHHDEYDTTTSQSKGFGKAEVKHYREMLYRYVEANFPGLDPSLDDAKNRWRLLLAGKLEASQRSSRLQAIMGKLRSRDAQTFKDFCGMVWRDREGKNYYQLVTQETERYARDEYGLGHSEFVNLDRAGLIDGGPGVQISLKKGRSLLLVLHDHGYRFTAETKPVVLRVRPLTADGQELMAISDAQLDLDYLDILFYTLPPGLDMFRNSFNEPPHPLVPEIAQQVADRCGKDTRALVDADYSQITEARVCSNNDTDDLQRLPNLRKLELVNGPIVDLSQLRHMTKLAELSFSGGKIPSLAPLKTLPALRSLKIHVGRELPDGLPDLSQLKRLSISLNFGGPAPSIGDLTALKNLETLVLACGELGPIDPLSELSQLRSLCLNQTPITDLSSLSGLRCLEQLFLYQVPVVDLTALSNLRKLTRLDIAHTKVVALGPLAGCQRLAELKAGCTCIEDLSPLAGHCELKALELFSTPVRDLTPLATAARLEKLHLSGTQVSNVDALSRLEGLRDLNLAGTPVSDAAALGSLTRLEKLDLSSTAVRDFAFLSTMTSLQTLTLRSVVVDVCPSLAVLPLKAVGLPGATLPSLDFLSDHPGLESLDLTDAAVDDFGALSSLPGLRSLKLGTTVEDLSFLKELHELERLELSATPVTNLEYLGGLTSLKQLTIKGITFGDITPLTRLSCLESVTFTDCDVPRSRLLPLRRALPKLTISAENWVDQGRP